MPWEWQHSWLLNTIIFQQTQSRKAISMIHDILPMMAQPFWHHWNLFSVQFDHHQQQFHLWPIYRYDIWPLACVRLCFVGLARKHQSGEVGSLSLETCRIPLITDIYAILFLVSDFLNLTAAVQDARLDHLDWLQTGPLWRIMLWFQV